MEVLKIPRVVQLFCLPNSKQGGDEVCVHIPSTAVIARHTERLTVS